MEEEVVSRRQLFLGWGAGLRRAMSDVIAAKLPMDLLQDPLDTLSSEPVPAPAPGPPPAPSLEATSQLMAMLGLDEETPAE